MPRRQQRRAWGHIGEHQGKEVRPPMGGEHARRTKTPLRDVLRHLPRSMRAPGRNTRHARGQQARAGLRDGVRHAVRTAALLSRQGWENERGDRRALSRVLGENRVATILQDTGLGGEAVGRAVLATRPAEKQCERRYNHLAQDGRPVRQLCNNRCEQISDAI